MATERGMLYRSPSSGGRWAFLMLILAAVGCISAAQAGSGHDNALPIVFVHGFNGSGAQYETQALRWASNDYPNIVTAIDRTATAGASSIPFSTPSSTP